MAYKILYGKELLYDGYTDEWVSDARLTANVNTPGYFDFTIHPGSPLIDKIEEKKDQVKLYFNDELLFEGYVESISTDIYGSKDITCASALSYLGWTLVRPYSTDPDPDQPNVMKAPTNTDAFFDWLIQQHNKTALYSWMQFSIGVNQGGYFAGEIIPFREDTSCPTTSDVIENEVLSYGGYLFLRYEGESRILDLYSDIHDDNTQIIDFGVNLIDFVKTSSTDNQYTAIRPIGGTPESEEGDETSHPAITLESLSDGAVDNESDYVKRGDVVYCDSAVRRYGYRETTYSNTDVVDPKLLLRCAVADLKKKISPVVTIEAKAVDLALYMEGYKHLQCGQAVRIRSKMHDLDMYLMVNSIDLDLLDPSATSYTLGTAFDTLTGEQSSYLRKLSSNINSAVDKVASIDQTAKDAADAAKDAIVSSKPEYYQSDSPTELVGGSWVETNVWQQGKYTWNRNFITYGDGRTEYAPSPTGICITGNTGDQGSPGEDGNTSYLHIAYADSADGTEGFTTTDPIGKTYIGQYTDFEQQPSTDPTKYAWTKIKGDTGSQGPQGKPGVSVVKITEYYLASPLKSGIFTSSEGWTTDIQIIDVEKPYLWNYEATEFSDGLIVYTVPVIIGTYGTPGPPGDQGPQGDPGKGIVAVVDEWYISTSSTDPEGGAWSETPSELPKDHYLWHRQKITWSDGSVTYTNSTVSQWVSKTDFQQTTDAIKATAESALTKIDNFDLPGTNLLLESSIANREKSSDTYEVAIYNFAKELELDQTYTISADITNDGRSKLAFFIGSEKIIAGDWLPLSSGEQKVYATFVATQAMLDTDDWVTIYAASTEEDQGDVPISGTCIVHRAKLEKGDTATEWSASPQDDAVIYTRISQLELTSKGLELLVGEAKKTADDAQAAAASNQQAITEAINDVNNTIDANTDHILSEMNQKMSLEGISGGWFRQTVEGGNPVLRMGATSNDLTVALSNAELAFYNGSQKLAYANGNAFAAPNMRVDSSLAMGRYVWIPGANGHLTLRYS